MKNYIAILINAAAKTVEQVEITDYKDINSFIDCRCFTIGAYLGNGTEKQGEDCVYVDDEGLLTGPEHFFTFEGASQPYAGNGLIVGSDFEGGSLDPLIDLETVKAKVQFKSLDEVRAMY